MKIIEPKIHIKWTLPKYLKKGVLLFRYDDAEDRPTMELIWLGKQRNTLNIAPLGKKYRMEFQISPMRLDLPLLISFTNYKTINTQQVTANLHFLWAAFDGDDWGIFLRYLQKDIFEPRRARAIWSPYHVWGEGVKEVYYYTRAGFFIFHKNTAIFYEEDDESVVLSTPIFLIKQIPQELHVENVDYTIIFKMPENILIAVDIMKKIGLITETRIKTIKTLTAFRAVDIECDTILDWGSLGKEYAAVITILRHL